MAKSTIAGLRREHLERLLDYTPEQGGRFSYNDLVYQYSQMPAFETDDYAGSLVGGFSVHELGALQATLDDFQAGVAATKLTVDPLIDARTRVIHASDFASLQDTLDYAASLSGVSTVRVEGPQVLTSKVSVTAPGVHLDLTDAQITAAFPGIAIEFISVPGARLSGGIIDLGGIGSSGVRFVDCPGAVAVGVQVKNTSTASGSSGLAFLRSHHSLVSGGLISNVVNGVTFEDSISCNVYGIKVVDAGHDGILFYNKSHHGSAVAVTVERFNLLTGAGRGGIQGYGVKGLRVLGCYILAGTGHGNIDSPCIRFRDVDDFTCVGNTTDGSGIVPGISVQALSDMSNLSGHGTIGVNTVLNSGFAAISIQTGSTGLGTDLRPIAVTGNFILGVRVSGPSAYGILVGAGVPAVAITGGYIQDCEGEGIITNATFGTITGVLIRQVGKSVGPRVGIFVTAGVTIVNGCLIVDDAAVPVMANAVRTLAGATLVEGVNHYQGWTSIAIRNDGVTKTQVGGVGTSLLGFYGKAPVAKPVLAANPSLAEIRAHLVAVGLA